MARKITMKGRFIQTGLLMLGLSLLIALVLVVVILALFAARVPEGEDFVRSVFNLFWGELQGPRRMLPYLIGGIILLCLCVAGMCMAVTSRMAGKLSGTLKTLCRAADNLREGELDFEILSCQERELDELCQSLESVRQRLKAAANAEAAAQEERGLLMANLSHDLRTPITAIKGYVEGIRDGVANTPEKRDHYLDTIYSKSLVLEKLVRNMSDFSEYELGRMQYHFEYVEMTAFLADLGEEYRQDAEGLGLTFTSRLPQGRYLVTADRSKLKRVLDNLVSNAIKYTRDGGRVKMTAGAKDGLVWCTVRDNGIGIPQQDVGRVFDRFYRVDKARSRESGGTGLGLSIASEIVSRHGGTLEIESKEGRGTAITVRLPVEGPAHE